jgi:hypothetical protein
VKPGDLIFVRGRSPIAHLIRLFDGEFSHAAICVSESNAILESQYFTDTVIKKNHYEDYEVVDLGLTNEQRKKIQELGLKLVGKYDEYDYKQFIWEGLQRLFRFKGKNKWNNPKQVICSELLVYLLLHIDYIKNLDEIEFILDSSPNELYKIVKHQLNN